MKLKTGMLLLLSVAFPSVLLAQAATAQMQCHTLASSGNYMAPDETYVNGMACKPVQATTRTSSTLITAAPLPATPTSSQKPAMQAMVLAPAVSTPVASAPTPVTPVETTPESVPVEAGMYVATAGSFTKILGQIIEFERTGSLLASKVTLGVKAAKGNAQLLGPHAQTPTATNPTFYFIPAKQEADAGVNAGDLILVRLEEKKERRQFEVGAEGVGRASKGISLTHQIQLNRSEVKPGVYQIAPTAELPRGEYGLYLARGEGLAPYIYDFSVQ